MANNPFEFYPIEASRRRANAGPEMLMVMRWLHNDLRWTNPIDRGATLRYAMAGDVTRAANAHANGMAAI